MSVRGNQFCFHDLHFANKPIQIKLKYSHLVDLVFGNLFHFFDKRLQTYIFWFQFGLFWVKKRIFSNTVLFTSTPTYSDFSKIPRPTWSGILDHRYWELKMLHLTRCKAECGVGYVNRTVNWKMQDPTLSLFHLFRDQLMRKNIFLPIRNQPNEQRWMKPEVVPEVVRNIRLKMELTLQLVPNRAKNFLVWYRDELFFANEDIR